MRLWKLVAFEPLKVGGSPFFRCATRAHLRPLLVSAKQSHFHRREDNPDWLTVEISCCSGLWDQALLGSPRSALANTPKVKSGTTRKNDPNPRTSAPIHKRYAPAAAGVTALSAAEGADDFRNPRRGSAPVRLLSVHTAIAIAIAILLSQCKSRSSSGGILSWRFAWSFLCCCCIYCS